VDAGKSFQLFKRSVYLRIEMLYIELCHLVAIARSAIDYVEGNADGPTCMHRLRGDFQVLVREF
jgi:hypothetical protein